MNKRFECRSCADRQCAAECEIKPRVCLRALNGEYDGPMPQWFEVGTKESSAAKAPDDKPNSPAAHEVPEWCKVGSWVYNETCGFGKVAIPSNHFGACIIDWQSGYRVGANHDDLSPARVRPWTFEEAPATLKIAPVDDPQYIGIVYLNAIVKGGVSVYGYGYLAHNQFHTLEWVAKFAIQLNGSPCGVLEVCNPA